ncbi:MAG: hypothetical protein GXO04_00565 [Aquificae bacterium]|nr:hypothetical protein [Aquificota bacterium]
MMASDRVESALKELEEKRKNGEISTKEFYFGLLDVVKLLEEELKKEDLQEPQIKKQIPFILTFIKTQIRELRARGN